MNAAQVVGMGLRMRMMTTAGPPSRSMNGGRENVEAMKTARDQAEKTERRAATDL